MSFLYREKDQNLYREYSLVPGGIHESFQSSRAKIDIVQTEEYGPMFFLDGVLQSSHIDEYIYHEFLVHPAMMVSSKKQKVCILGGGDGSAAREVLKWNSVQSIDLYDWDEELVKYFSTKGKLWNQGSLRDPKLKYYNTNIESLFSTNDFGLYDVILVDLLDPEYAHLQDEHGFWIQLLNLVKRWRKPGGSIVINGGGVTPWQNAVFKLLKSLCTVVYPDQKILPYKVFVPSFGREWAFLLLVEPNSNFAEIPFPTRRFTFNGFKRSIVWEPDFKIDE